MNMVSRIRKLCKQQDLSLFDLEEKAGVKHGNIYRWDTNVPSVDKVSAVAKCLGTTIDYLAGNDDDGNTVDQAQYNKGAAELLKLYDDLGYMERNDLIWYAKVLKTKYKHNLPYHPYDINPDPLSENPKAVDESEDIVARIAKNLGVTWDEEKGEWVKE